MSEIFVWPDELSIPFADGANLLEAAIEAGVPIAHLCGGRARCSTCRVRIIEGEDSLTERTEPEAAMAAKLEFPDEIRLAVRQTLAAPFVCGGSFWTRSMSRWLPN